MKKIIILPVLLFFALIIIAHSAFAESWDDNLIITAPTSHDVLTAELNDLECAALAVYFEARGEPSLGMELIAQLVVNRIGDYAYESTACAVIREPKQFSWTHDGRSDRPTNLPAYEASYKLAIAYLYMGKTAPVPQASEILNVHATHDEYNQPVNPDWSDRQEIQRVGRQVFYVRA